MTCNPIKVDFVKSYDDLVGKPSINGVTLEGNISFDDLGLYDWLADETKNFATKTDIEDATSKFIRNSSDGATNTSGFILQFVDENQELDITFRNAGVEIVEKILGVNRYTVDIYPDIIGIYEYYDDMFTEISPNSIYLYGNGADVVLDAETLQALIDLL